MGKSKKRFIPKGQGEQYYLLHRSQTDSAHLGEAPPSKFVLVKANEISETHETIPQVDPFSKLKMKHQDHITSLGFKNDGYDYSQHLKEMGGGRFIGKNGKVSELPVTAKSVELPADALPSGSEFDRHLEAITISEEFMDDDLRDALFGEDGDFEQLDDDFVSSAMSEPAAPDFDYEAHIAMLIAKSEGYVAGQNTNARGWNKHEDQDDDQDEGEDDEDGEVSSYNPEDYEEDHQTSHPHSKTSSEYMKLIEEQFEKTMEDYGDENIGDLEDEAEDEDLQGLIDFESNNNLLESALDEFLQESHDNQLAEGVVIYQKGSRTIKETEELTEEELARKVKEFVLESTEELEVTKVDTEKDIQEMMASQEYLREEKPQEKWDCETILSTYSTLDNHPSLIQKERNPKKKSGNKDGKTGFYSRGALKTTEEQQKKIELGGKYMLPKESNKKIKPKKKLMPIESESESESEKSETDSESEDENNNNEEEETENNGDEENENKPRLKREKPKPLRKRETAEEKKLRKLQVKQERRDKRASKKGLKTAFKDEEVRIGKIVGQSQDVDRVSIFKYS
mmetsp:Transcript_19075/g.19816  ORF Transcript_19075/g.19816 Transcript_19075/m.19816 type:complete len:568 (+) Transcript_19075:20-1723(+)